MIEKDANQPIKNDPMEKRNKFIDHPSYLNLCVTIDITRKLTQYTTHLAYERFSKQILF